MSAVNVSEGRDPTVIEALAAAAGDGLLDVHHDPDHHRSVFTVAGEASVRALATAAVARLDLGGHTGVHPRAGVVDVVPFAPVDGRDLGEALAARDRFAAWSAGEGVPCFLYGPERSLPELRRAIRAGAVPDVGGPEPHPRAGVTCVGARGPLVAYNLWLATPDLDAARRVAREIRAPALRTLALTVGTEVQVSCNLVDPDTVGPAEAYDAVAGHIAVGRAELVGLVPERVLRRIDPSRWGQLDVSEERTVEHRLRRRERA